jgi:hypothetical protein
VALNVKDMRAWMLTINESRLRTDRGYWLAKAAGAELKNPEMKIFPGRPRAQFRADHPV